MKRHIKWIWSMLLVAMLCISAIPVTAFAAENVRATIPLSVTANGKNGNLSSDIPKETYTFVLKSQKDAPLPAENVISIKGAGSGKFEIPLSTVGVYHYTVSQDVSSLTGNGIYDTNVYYITVTVSHAGEGKLRATVASRKGNATSKKSDIKFDNTYPSVEDEDSLTVKKTWTDNGATRPSSIRVQLLDGTKVVETVELTAAGGWIYTWTKLDKSDSHDWNVKEVAVNGYTAEYSKKSDGTITIHNTGTPTGKRLIQTGQINWPIPFLGVLGCVLIIGGAYVVKKSRRKNNG